MIFKRYTTVNKQIFRCANASLKAIRVRAKRNVDESIDESHVERISFLFSYDKVQMLRFSGPSFRGLERKKCPK